MPRPSLKDRARLNLKMSEAVRLQMESLQQRTGADSLTEVIRRSLAYHDLIQSAKESGASVLIRYPDGTEKEIVIV